MDTTVLRVLWVHTQHLVLHHVHRVQRGFQTTIQTRLRRVNHVLQVRMRQANLRHVHRVQLDFQTTIQTRLRRVKYVIRERIPMNKEPLYVKRVLTAHTRQPVLHHVHRVLSVLQTTI